MYGLAIHVEDVEAKTNKQTTHKVEINSFLQQYAVVG